MNPSVTYCGEQNPIKALQKAKAVLADMEYWDTHVTEVNTVAFVCEDGFSSYVMPYWPVQPKVGSLVRVYGRYGEIRMKGLCIDRVPCRYYTGKNPLTLQNGICCWYQELTQKMFA